MRLSRVHSSSLAALVATLIVVASARAQDAEKSAAAARAQVGRILGVFDPDGNALEGAEVIDRIGGGTMRTARAGLVGMAALSSQHDSAVVTIRKIGFADTTVLVMVGQLDTIPMAVFMRRATALEQMTITAKETEHLPFYLKDFEERLDEARWRGSKTFTPAEFRKREGMLLLSVLATKNVPNKSIDCVVIYLDGVRWTPFDLGKATVDDFDAAVFYTLAQMPSELQRTSATPICGALLLYSRH